MIHHSVPAQDIFEKCSLVFTVSGTSGFEAAFYNKPTIAVDTHLFRLSNRIGIAAGETPLEFERNLLKVLPNWALENAHHWLILHGRYICKARSPLCERCLINNECEYEKKIF